MNFNNQNFYTLLFSDKLELKKSVDPHLQYYGTTFLNKYTKLSNVRNKSDLFKEISKKKSLFYVVVNNTIGKIDQRVDRAKSDMIEYGKEEYRSVHQKTGAEIDGTLRMATAFGTEDFLKLIFSRIYTDFIIMGNGDNLFAKYLGLTTKWRNDVQKGRYSLRNGVVLPYHMEEVERLISKIVKTYGPAPKPSEFIKLVEEEKQQIIKINNFIERLLRERPPIQAELINELEELKEELSKGLEDRKKKFIEKHQDDETEKGNLKDLYEQASANLAEKEKEFEELKKNNKEYLKDLEDRYEKEYHKMENTYKMMIRDEQFKCEGRVNRINADFKKRIVDTQKNVKVLEKNIEELKTKEMTLSREVLKLQKIIEDAEKEKEILRRTITRLEGRLLIEEPEPTAPEVTLMEEEEKEVYKRKIRQLEEQIIDLKKEATPAALDLAELRETIHERTKRAFELEGKLSEQRNELVDAYNELRETRTLRDQAEERVSELEDAMKQTKDEHFVMIARLQRENSLLNQQILKLRTPPTQQQFQQQEQQQLYGLPVQREASVELVNAIKDQNLLKIVSTNVGNALAIIDTPQVGINEKNQQAVVLRVLELLAESFNHHEEERMMGFIRALSQIQVGENLFDEKVIKRFQKNINILKTNYSKNIRWEEEDVVPEPAFFVSLRKTINNVISDQIDEKVRLPPIASVIKSGNYGIIEKIIYLCIISLTKEKLEELGISYTTDDDKKIAFSTKLINLTLFTLCNVYVSMVNSKNANISEDDKVNKGIINFYQSIRELTAHIWSDIKVTPKIKMDVLPGTVINVIEHKFDPYQLGIDFIIPSIRYFLKDGFLERVTDENISKLDDLGLSSSLYFDVKSHVDFMFSGEPAQFQGDVEQIDPDILKIVEKEVKYPESPKFIESTKIKGEVFSSHVKEVKKMVHKKKFYIGCYTTHNLKLQIPKTGRFYMKFDYDNQHVFVKFSKKKKKESYKFNAGELYVTDGDEENPYSFGLYDKSSESSVTYDFCVTKTHPLSIKSLSSVIRSLYQLGANMMDMANMFSIKSIVIKSKEYPKFKFGWLTKMSDKNFIRLMDENYGVKKILEVEEILQPSDDNLSLNIVGFTKILKTIKRLPVLRKKYTIQIIVHDNSKNREVLELIKKSRKLEKKIGKSITKTEEEEDFDFNDKVIEEKVTKSDVLLKKNDDDELLEIVQNICDSDSDKEVIQNNSNSDSDSDVVKGIIDFL
jgi:hypothetical protein